MALLKMAVLLLLLRVSFTSAELKNITVTVGQDATLPCRSDIGNHIRSVEWNRADLESDYVLLFRHEKYDARHQYPLFMNRVELQDRQMKDGDLSLVLRNVTTDDSGTYECRVSIRRRRKRTSLDSKPISIIQLTVVPQSAEPKGEQSHSGDSNSGSGRLEDSLPLLALLLFLVLFLVLKKIKTD